MKRYLAPFFIMLIFTYGTVTAGDLVNPPERSNLATSVRTVSGVTIDETPATFKITLPDISNVAPTVPKIPVEGEEGETGETTDDGAPDNNRVMLYPSYLEAAGKAKGTVLPSLDLCGYRGLSVYDGGFASAQMKLEFGVGVLAAGEQKFLIDLANALSNYYNNTSKDARDFAGKALVFIVVGVMLGESNGELPPEVSVNDDIYKEAEKTKKEFEKEEQYRSSAFGIYLWSEDLKRLCIRNRWLSYLFWPGERDYNDFEQSLVMSEVIASNPSLLEQHKYIFAFYSAVGNATRVNSVSDYAGYLGGRNAAEMLNAEDLQPLRDMQLDIIGTRLPFQLLPEPRIEQADLINRVVTDKSGMSSGVLGTVIGAIRAGQMNLTPGADTGYLGYQEYATAAKLNPMSTSLKGKVEFGDSYNLRLESGMRTSFVQRYGSPSGITEGNAVPALTVEPLPDYYLRMARALAYLDKAYRTTMGEDYDNLHGIRPGGKPVNDAIPDEIAAARDLYYGLYLESCVNLGIKPALSSGEGGNAEALIDNARKFASGWKDDPDYARDIRYLYPIGPAKTATGKEGIDYIAVMGVQPVDIVIEYVDPPRVSGAETVTPGASRYTILVPVVEELVIPGRAAFTQEEFIAVCDEYKSKDEIIAALGRRGAPLKEGGKKEGNGEKGWLLEHLDIDIVILCVVFLAFAVIITVFLIVKRSQDRDTTGFDD